MLLGWIDVNVDVDEDDSPMLREERRTKGQQSFTIRFRRDKLAVIFSRIWSSQPLGVGVAKPQDAPASTLAGPVDFGYARFGFKKQTSQTSLASLSLRPNSDARGQCMPAVPSAQSRGCPHLLRCYNLDLHSQFGPLRMGMHCGKKGRGAC